MRFLTFELTAYGPFTEKRLDLSEGEEGLHLIYGPNEAGKSAALRALTNLLYGIPPRTSDNFLHDNPRLRIGAGIRHSDGSKLHIVRRKGLKDTLLTPSGEVLPDPVLDKYLVDITRELFTTMFGMDHEVLVEGGRALVSGGGDIGQSLFAAGMGISGMRDIVESLDTEAGELFRPRGKITTINRLIQDFKALKKQCAKSSLSSKDWSVHDERLRSATREKQVVQQDLQKHLSDRNRLERIQKAIPRIVSLEGHRAELKKMGEVVFLPTGFSEQRQEIQESLRRAQFSEARLKKDLDKINEDVAKISPAESVIQAQDEIKDLFLRLGSHKKAMLDLPRRRADNYRLLEEAQAILKKLGPQWSIENAESLRLTDSQIARIRKLGRELDPLLERLQTSGRAESDLESEIRVAKEESARLPEEQDPRKLETALAQARKQGDLSGYLLKIKTELKTRQKKVDLHLKGLGLWTGSMAELEAMAVPSAETVDQFEKDFSELNARCQRLEQSISEQNERLLGLDRRTEALRAAGSIPSEDDLQLARKRRNEGWSLVRDAWLLGTTDIDKNRAFDPEAKDLAEAYEKSVRAADEIGDRLRNESERVAKQAGFMADRQETLKRIAALQENLGSATEALSELETLWISLWEPLRLHPRTPKEMRGWLQKYDRLMGEGADVRDRRAELDRVTSLIKDLRSNLNDRLKEMAEITADADEKLDDLMDRSDALVKAIQTAGRRRENLAAHMKDLERRNTTATQNLKQAEEAQRAWQKKWGAAVKDLNLDAQSLPVEADAVLDRINELFERIDQAQLMQGRIQAIEADGEEFSQSVKDLCGRVAIDIEDTPPEEAAAVLNTRLEKALMDAARLDELEKQQKTAVQTIRSEHIIIEECEAKLK